MAPNFTYSQKSYFFKPLLSYNFYGTEMYEMYFFIFASCEQLSVFFCSKDGPIKKKCF